MEINHEFWKLVATGLLGGGVGSGSLMELLSAITDRDKRRRLIDCGAVSGHFVWLTYFNAAFGYVIDERTLEMCWAFIADKYYNPHIKSEIPTPSGIVVTEGVISATDPGAGYTLYLYAWNYISFAEIGPLAEHSDPGAGAYVLVVKVDGQEVWGLPSTFITVS